MKNFLLLCTLLLLIISHTSGQKKAFVLDASGAQRCATNEKMQLALKQNPGLRAQWKAEGEKRYRQFLKNQMLMREADEEDEIIIPIVFHIVDDAAHQAWITDRDIYEQVEILNNAYQGTKAAFYRQVIPAEMYARLGRINIKFVLAKRTPSGTLTSGIERRTAPSPDRISIKSTADGGLDAWDTEKYLNVWAGTFSGDDEGLLGIATFPFITDEGPQGVVIGTGTLPYTSNVSRGYYPAYSEGATLAHEIGHYFYLWHTFGDQTVCNNDDFRIEDGWDLADGAGPEGDDTPEEKAGPGFAYFGNPSQNYSDGCTNLSYGMMYGSFMNYFDDRALFMFSDGHRKRVESCIDIYRPGLKTSDGATPPVDVLDAYLVTLSSRGTPERREQIVNNTPLSVVVRNYGSVKLNSVNVGYRLDANATVSTAFALNLDPGKDTVLTLAPIVSTAGNHVLTLSLSSPNGGTDMFPENDVIESFIFMTGSTINAPFYETFSGSTFPPEGWQIWNPQDNTTWVKNNTSGYEEAGSATVQNYNYNGGGQLDELISPAINLGGADSALLQFKVAHGVYSLTDVSAWDGLEVYISNNGGETYRLAYKKTGNQLKTISAAQSGSFSAPPTQRENWRQEDINLTPYIIPGKNMLVKFRNVNGYGNNLYLDEIRLSVYTSLSRDAFPVAVLNVPDYLCEGAPVPSVVFGSNGKSTLSSLKLNYQLNGASASVEWDGTLERNQTDTVQLPALTSLQPGQHTLTIITSLPNGLPDQDFHNDTISRTFYVIGKVNPPLTEDFEGGSFPPPSWALGNPDGGLTWQKSAAAADGSAAMVLKNYDQATEGTNDKFISSYITGNNGFDSVFVSFDYAYAPGIHYPGTIDGTLDTLEIQVTSDCGDNMTTVWKKWGHELQTIGDPNQAMGKAFIPNATQWKNIRIALFPYVGNNDFQVYFVAKSNKQNNVYIDNINIYGIKVPARLKEQGYLIYPSPFHTQFIIRNYEAPTTFQRAAMYNALGQLVWSKNFNGQAQKEETVNAGKLAPGIYTVKLFYNNKTVVERIVKQ